MRLPISFILGFQTLSTLLQQQLSAVDPGTYLAFAGYVGGLQPYIMAIWPIDVWFIRIMWLCLLALHTALLGATRVPIHHPSMAPIGPRRIAAWAGGLVEDQDDKHP
jgi:hypothetical protein